MSIYVLSHTNPDTDSIVGSISLAYLKNELGGDYIPIRQGKISPETEFVLNKFGATVPELKTEVAGEEVYLVDFGDLAQSPKDIKEATIVGMVDHHKLGDITTDAPIEAWIRPFGASNTILKEMYDYYNIDIPKDLAGMMMCAILSDTVIFKSPTCTKVDTKAVKELAKIAGIEDYKALGMEMFIVKSAVEGTSARDLVTRDYKEFDMNGSKVGIGQLEVVDLHVFDDKKEMLFEDMRKLKEENGLHSIALLLTDIMIEGSQILVVSDDESKFEKAFDTKLQNHEAWLDKVLSRKKQVIPFVQPQF